MKVLHAGQKFAKARARRDLSHTPPLCSMHRPHGSEMCFFFGGGEVGKVQLLSLERGLKKLRVLLARRCWPLLFPYLMPQGQHADKNPEIESSSTRLEA
jgi:hypothetical protein